MARIQHPLFEELRQFDAAAKKRFNSSLDGGIDAMGMYLLSQLEHGGYFCTPKNSLSFAATGGDGVHFSFLLLEDEQPENWPVIVTVPCVGENHIVAENLRDFLRFGLWRGYFAIEQLAYYPDLTLQAYGSPDWQPTDEWHYSVGYYLDEKGQQVRDLLVEKFGLTPLAYTTAEFEALQAKYVPLLDLPTEEEW